MKPAPFDLIAAHALDAAAAALAANTEARIMAGGQSLGPMLNLRVARPGTLVSITRIAELGAVEESKDFVTLGACVTHAAIADRRVPDIGLGILPRIAEGIAYRAVRNRGTIGGSLCHADPAADWVCTLTALDATVLTRRRAIDMTGFIAGAFRTVLEPGEIVLAVRIPRLSTEASWGYYKACRKPGEFAHAMAAVLIDPSRDLRRAVIGAVGGPPILLQGPEAEPETAARILANAATGLDKVDLHLQIVALKRALAEAAS